MRPYGLSLAKGVTLAVTATGLLMVVLCSRPVAKLVGKTVEVPSFAIAIKLSDQAEKRLRNMGETVKVIAYFDGDALPGKGKYNPPFRDVYLGSDEKLVDSGFVARFDKGTVLLSDWNRLADKDYFVTINTVSARKADPNNLLWCADPIGQRIQSFAGKTIPVQCRLIGEPPAAAK